MRLGNVNPRMVIGENKALVIATIPFLGSRKRSIGVGVKSYSKTALGRNSGDGTTLRDA
jgi:hypothetical protein